MAVTKIHPIKRALKAAIDYICNPEKTDGKLLVSSYGCVAETADIEFAWTRRHAIDKGTNLGRHLIQAFQPGEVTPEQAHEIGMELAKEILGGKYEFVLTTHIDKDHVHNHLIFNAVSFADHKHYHSNKRSYHDIRRTSDWLCKEHGLSVIIPGQDKGKSYIERQAAQNGTSYKAKLKAAIDRLLPACSNLEELLRRLQREGYEIKRGKYISARAPDQERFTRLKTLGVDYTEEALAARIAGRSRPSHQPKQRNGKINLLIDIQNNIKAQQSAGYRRWATAADGRRRVCHHGGLNAAPWNCGKRPLCRWKSHSPPDGKGQAFPTGRQTAFPQRCPAWPFAHSPTAPATAAAARIVCLYRKNHHFMVE